MAKELDEQVESFRTRPNGRSAGPRPAARPGPAQRRGRAAPARVGPPVRSPRALLPVALPGQQGVGAPYRGKALSRDPVQHDRGALGDLLVTSRALLLCHLLTLAVIRRDSGHYPA